MKEFDELESCSEKEQDFLPVDVKELGVEAGATECGGAAEVTTPENSRVEPFFGEQEPAYGLKSEQPHHRVICFLAAQGLTNKEIAEQTGFHAATVAYTKKQPWAQKLIAELIRQHGERAVKTVFQGKAVEMAKVLIEIAEGQHGAKASDRAKAANAVLDRLYGTAPQIVRTESVDAAQISDDELAAIISGNN